MILRFFRTVLLLLDKLLLLLFLIGYAARYVQPRYAWWAELIATGLPYLSMLLVGATVLVALARRWKWLAVHCVLLVLALFRFVPLERGAAPGPDDLVLLTFNTSRGGGARAEEQERAITALVRAEKPDLVGLQEAYVEYFPTGRVRPGRPLATLIDTLGYRTIGPSPARPRGTTYTSQPVLAHLELLEQTQIPLATGGEPPAHVVRTRFRWQGREAVHYNLHLRSFGSQKPWDDRRQDLFSAGFWTTYLRQYREAYLERSSEMEQIRKLIDKETLPLIVSGDFNSTPHNRVYYGLADGLQDAFKAAGHGWGATYHAEFPVARIDYVLVSREWKVVEAHVSRAPFSDHLPLIVRLRWRE